jgi:hypothetical protein
MSCSAALHPADDNWLEQQVADCGKLTRLTE